MHKRSSKTASDENVTAFEILKVATGEAPSSESTGRPKKKNPAAVALGRLGGKKGGIARAKKLSAAQRKAIAKLAAKTRWGIDR